MTLLDIKNFRSITYVALVIICSNVQAIDTDESDFDCLIEPFVQVDIGSPIKGVLLSLSVEKNDTVKKGQVLAKLESTVEKANVDLARARSKLDGEIQSGQVTLAMVSRQQTRISDLFEKKAVSSQKKDEADMEKQLADLNLKKIKKKKELAHLELQRAIASLERRTVRSPLSGIVIERYMSPGEFVKELPILKIAKIDPLKVEAVLPASLFGKIKKGMRAEVTPELPKNTILHGKISAVDRIIDASSGTFRVNVLLPNKDHAMPGGLRCKIKFQHG
ncbi:MAG: efflux RND transporter periplasmic adaptor subunit [Gammaproteobacteria bacterium]|nr:efflux RND transporter periplasmic adaptor subunit [Gammaproteobacteria bacterium]